MLNSIGFKGINCDIIYGVQNDTLESMKKDFDVGFSLPITHLSAYSLTIEEGTKFFDRSSVKLMMKSYLMKYLII